MTMVPEAWEKDMNMNVEKKAFYNWSAMAMEPWDGPGRSKSHEYVTARKTFAALLTFSDGRYIGAILDRNGLRPARYYLSADNVLYMSSETGVTDLKHNQCVQKVSSAYFVSREWIMCGERLEVVRFFVSFSR